MTSRKTSRKYPWKTSIQIFIKFGKLKLVQQPKVAPQKSKVESIKIGSKIVFWTNKRKFCANFDFLPHKFPLIEIGTKIKKKIVPKIDMGSKIEIDTNSCKDSKFGSKKMFGLINPPL